MGDLLCRVCSEPWDAWGLHHGDVMAWEAKLFKAGAGCPSCKGVPPEGTSPADADARELAAVESMADNWDDPDSFPLVLDTFASAVTGKMPARRPWKAPEQKVLWQCAGCEVKAVASLRFSLCEENPPDQQREWQGGQRVHYLRGVAFTTSDIPGQDDPEETAPHTIDGKPYCDNCAATCDGDGCRASIFQRSDLQGDSYDAGSAFSFEGDYHNSYCVACFEQLSAEQAIEDKASARRDTARDAWNARYRGDSNEAVRAMIQKAMRNYD
jgi:hypothetical protein